MTMIETDKEHFKQINIYLVDGSRYVVIPSDDNLAKYVKGNFYGAITLAFQKMKRNQLFMSGFSRVEVRLMMLV